MLKKLQGNKIQTSFVLPDGIGAFVGAGGAGVLFSKALTLTNSSSITEQAIKGREKLLKSLKS